jgi:hypothetical protein
MREGHMSAEEFVRTFGEERRIEFGDSVLAAPTKPIADALLDALGPLLTPAERVTYGVQTRSMSFGRDQSAAKSPSEWIGTLEWFLVLRHWLVRVTAHLTRGDQEDSISTASSIYPLAALARTDLEIRYREVLDDERVGVAVREIKVTLAFGGQALEFTSGDELGVSTVQRLVTVVLEASRHAPPTASGAAWESHRKR